MAKTSEQKGTQFLHYFGPLLDALRALGGSGTPPEVSERIAKDQNVPDEVQNELLPSGGSRYHTNVAWARFYLAREGLLDSSRRGVWSLTERGRATTLAYEQAREIFRRWVRIDDEKRKTDKATAPPETRPTTSEDSSAAPTDYRAELVQLLLSLPAAGFERLCQRLLREAGFVQVTVTGSTGDGGIDGYGTLQVNPLVSFKVLFQCKRYAKSVTTGHVRDFRGAMAGRADKGIILTTGTFTADARREASRDGVPPIELVDGDKLIDMFESLEFGLRSVTTYELDRTFFEAFKA